MTNGETIWTAMKAIMEVKTNIRNIRPEGQAERRLLTRQWAELKKVEKALIEVRGLFE